MAAAPADAATLAAARTALLHAVFGAALFGPLSPTPYLAFAEARCQDLHPLLRQGAPHLLCHSDLRQHAPAHDLRLLAQVAAALRDESGARTIDDVIESVVEANAGSTEPWTPQHWADCRHACIACVGLVSMLWTVENVVSGPPLRLARKDKPLAEACGQPMTTFHRDACGTLPRPAAHPALPAPINTHVYASAVSYWSLWKFAGIRIAWTEDMSMHLEFEPRKRRLHLFSLPTYCALSCAAEETSLSDVCLKKLYGVASTSYASTETSFLDETLVSGLKREILLSYRVIFGQHRQSRSWFRNEHRQHRIKTTDSLLVQLCTYSQKHLNASLPAFLWPDSCRDFSLGEAGEFRELDAYDLEVDFPILGFRLRKLVEYSSRQNPRKLRDMFRDFRNPIQWYTVWLVITFGFIATILGVIQVALSGAQLAATLKQL